MNSTDPKNQKPASAESSGKVKSENALREESLLQFWQENKIFEKTLEKDSPMGEYNFFEGPPTANGHPGLHHVEARSYKDIIPRYKTMQGFSVRRKAGWDTHGLPVELQVEKALGLKSKKEIEQYGVAEFNKKCRESVWQYRSEWEQLTNRMAFWVDMKNPYVTYENNYIEALWGIVKRADERGHLYKDFKVLPWCTRCGTALSSHELNQPGAYKDVKDLSVFAKFPIVGFDKAYFLAWTTTPWTLPGNIALAVGADIDYVEAKVGDEILVLAKDLVKILPEGFEIIAEHKGSEMVGMQYQPLFPFMQELLPEHQHAKRENSYKVYAADFVTTTDGTGIVHTAVMYGADDFELGTKVGLPKFHLVNEEGKFIDGCDTDALKLSGRYVKEKDENGKPTLAVDIIDDLTARGLLFKKENYTHSYPHCWRCDTPLIYYARTSWYFNMSKLREQLLAANQKINWEPDHIKEGRFGEWLDGIKDWAISRDRYWGTPLPVWETGDKKHKFIPGSLQDLKDHTKKSGNKYFLIRHGEGEHNLLDIRTSDQNAPYHLTEKGKQEVHVSAEELKSQGITKIISSNYFRTKETAEIVAGVIGFSEDQIVIDDRVGEYNYGAFDGKKTEEYYDWRKSINAGFDTQTLGDGDSAKSAKLRIAEFLYDIESKYQNENILIVSHGIFNEVIPSICEGWSDQDTWKNWHEGSLKTGSWKEFNFIPLPHNESHELDFHKPFIDAVELELNGEKLYRTPEVMDVWFDSGSMPFAQDHKLGEPINFDPKPADYIAEGVDQTRGWFYTMHAVSNMMHDVPTEAYKNVICLGLLMDANGIKMSKSKGNIVEPWEMFDKYGADVARFWFYSVNQPGDVKNFDEKGLDDVNKKVFNLLRNVVSFYEMYAHEVPSTKYQVPNKSENVLDQWIITLLNNLISKVTDGLDKYQIMEPARAIRDFVGELSTWYIRRSRDRFKSEDVADKNFAIATTQYVLIELAKVMAPFTPFVAEEIFQKLKTSENAESVHLEKFPKSDLQEVKVLEFMQDVRELVTLGLEARAKANIKVRQPLAKISVANQFKDLSEEYLAIVQDELNVKEVLFDEKLADGEVVLDTEITEDLQNEGDMRETLRMIQDMRKSAGLSPSDRVIVSLADAEPKWFAQFAAELSNSVGAVEIKWGNGESRVDKVA